MKRAIRIAVGALVGVLLAGVALAGTRTVTATITTTSGNCLDQLNNRTWLTLDATGAAANIGYCFGDACTASIGTAGTTTIPSGTLHYFTPGATPTDEMCFVAASGSQPLTIREGFR